MTSKFLRFVTSCAFALSAPAALYAQTATPPEVVKTSDAEAATPWLYEGSDVPVDKSWTFGTLPNGLRYAVKKNIVPAGQVSIRVRIDAGALHENDDERGFAHLIEHLSFRGSVHVPDGEAKRIWQRFGVTFGSDSNAQTTPTQTVYKLDLPNAQPATLNESMKILSGMIREPRISDVALNAERSIVLAELRESSGVQAQYADKFRGHIFQGQRLANRGTIGTVETLQASKAPALDAFHKRWYRPENAVIVIAGDSDPATLAALVKTYFADWKGKGVRAAEPDFGKPVKSDKTSEVIVAPTLPTGATIAYVRPWIKKNDTIVYNQQLLINALAVQIINRRLEAAARSGSSFILADVKQDDYSRSGDVTTVSITPVGNQWEQAIKDVRSIIFDATQTPPSDIDINREKTLFANALRTGLDSYPFEAASKQAEDIVTAVDIRETVAAPQTVVDVFANMNSMLTPERLLQSTKSLFEAAATRIFLSSPKAEANTPARLTSALSATVKPNTASRLANTNMKFSDLPALGKAGKAISSSMNERFQIETVNFSNGTRALLYPNKAENGQIRMLVRFGRGYQSFTPSTGNLLWAGDLVLGENGVGKFTRTQLDQLTVGRRISLDFAVDSDSFKFSSTTRGEDLADQLRLIATKLEHPGWADAPVNRAKALAKSGFDSFEMSAASVLQRDLDYLIRGKDMRWKAPDPASIAQLSPKSFRAFWQPLLAQGPIEISIFGDFERANAVKALEETFGAMKPRTSAAPKAESLQLKFPEPTSSPVRLTHKGASDQVAAVVAWPTGGGIERITESRELEILASIFRDRLFEKFRAERAASYSPDMSNSWPEEFSSGGYLMAYTQVQPKDVDNFFDFAREVAADLKSNQVSEDELKRAVEPIKQYIERASSGNTFWLNYLQGAAYDPRRFKSLSHLYTDFNGVTPARLQQLAQTYFRDDKSWKLVVEPERKSVNGSQKVR
jgi:zinc protease